MHKNFGEWYRLVSIEPTTELLEKRWAGVETWLSTIRSDDDAILETVRIFQGLREKTSRDAFLAAFRDQDAAFAQRNNELEQRVLAGAALVECTLAGRMPTKEEGSAFDGAPTAVIAGTAVAASQAHSSEDALRELTEEVLSGLHELARHQRKRTDFDPVILGSKAEEALTKALTQVQEAPDHNHLRAHVSEVFKKLVTAIRRSENALKSAAHDLRCADEETNILWWLAGGSSRDLNEAWSALQDAAPLVAGWELADLTDVALGPQDAAALLDRVVPKTAGGSKDQPIQVYVNAVPDHWAKAIHERLSESALDLTPLSLALSQRSKSNTSSWQQFFDLNSGLKASTKLSPERAAHLAYAEAMLHSTLSRADR